MVRPFGVLVALTVLSASVGCGERSKSDAAPARSDNASGGESETTDRAPTGGHLAVTGTIPMDISAVVGGKNTLASGVGECRFEPNGSIYQKPAALWRITYNDAEASGLRSLNMTVWRLKSGGAEQVSLSLQVGGTTHELSTIEGGELKGRASVSAPEGGEGGRLRVEGEDARGTALAVTVDCPRFTGIEAEGG